MAGKTKIPRDDVVLMFQLHYQHGVSQRQIAHKFEYERTYVGRILRGKALTQWSADLLVEYGGMRS